MINRIPRLSFLPILLSILLAGCGPKQARAAQPQGAVAVPDRLELSGNPDALSDRLYPQIWMEISPEYRALCYQAFNAALLHVSEIVEESPHQDQTPVGATGKPLAVVADLDETILDNGGYQRQLVLENKEYSSPSWNQWGHQPQRVRLVPGAGRFIQDVEELGVTMIYLSNRRISLSQPTIEALRLNGIDTEGLDDPDSVRLLLRTDESDKEPRRLQALERYEVIAFLGDNLGDFPALVSAGEGLERIDHYRELWGTRWFVLPNPSYGSWTDAFRGQDPREFLMSLPPR